MEIHDLTHPMSNRMPVYPGTKEPKISVEFEVQQDGFEERRLEFFSHNGTHMDAPAHLISEGKRLDDYPITSYCGSGVVVDLSDVEGATITLEELKKKAGSSLEEGKFEFILLHTGWDQRWETEQYFRSWPYLEPELAGYLSSLNPKGIGIDSPSVDPMENPKEEGTMKAHKRILGKDILIYENLKGLQKLAGKGFDFFGLPLRMEDAEGAPVRAVAIVRPERGGD